MSLGRAAALNSRFGVPGVGFRPGPGGLECVEVENRLASATVLLQGAQLLSWAPRGDEPVIWLSEAARFAPGAPVRGGIPICWPWFGPHPTDPARPQHGFARTSEWQVVAVERLPDERTRLTFRLPDGHGGEAWPHRTEVLCVVTVGRTLELDLVTRNAGEEAIEIGQALHTYFRVSDYERVTVHGVEGCRYLDKATGGQGLQDRALTLSGKVDRIFLGSSRDCIIEDPGLSRAIRVAKRGSSSTVVWNPGLSGASGDFGPRGSRELLCLETANVADDAVRLAPHAVHVLFARMSVGPLG